MANAIKWEAAWNSRGNVLTTQLNSLADGSRTAAGAEISNQTNLDQYGKLELNVTFGSVPGTGAYVAIYQVTAPDGTNYEDGSSSVDPGMHTCIARIPVRGTTSAQRLMSPVFQLQPAKTKYLLENQAGQAFPASGSTVELFTSNDEVQ
jgi:hypothetical protein